MGVGVVGLALAGVYTYRKWQEHNTAEARKMRQVRPAEGGRSRAASTGGMSRAVNAGEVQGGQCREDSGGGNKRDGQCKGSAGEVSVGGTRDH